MRYIKSAFLFLFLTGCSTNIQQYANNYKNNSIYGTWEEFDSKDVNELIIKKDGNFTFTAMPFEIYKDYWGRYNIDKEKHIINFTIEGGNNIPKDAKLKNVKYAFDKNGRLVLTNFYYGSVSKNSKKRDIYIFKHF